MGYFDMSTFQKSENLVKIQRIFFENFIDRTKPWCNPAKFTSELNISLPSYIKNQTILSVIIFFTRENSNFFLIQVNLFRRPLLRMKGNFHFINKTFISGLWESFFCLWYGRKVYPGKSVYRGKVIIPLVQLSTNRRIGCWCSV